MCPNVQVPWSTERQQGNEPGQEVKAKGKVGLETECWVVASGQDEVFTGMGCGCLE